MNRIFNQGTLLYVLIYLFIVSCILYATFYVFGDLFHFIRVLSLLPAIVIFTALNPIIDLSENPLVYVIGSLIINLLLVFYIATKKKTKALPFENKSSKFKSGLIIILSLATTYLLLASLIPVYYEYKETANIKLRFEKIENCKEAIVPNGQEIYSKYYNEYLEKYKKVPPNDDAFIGEIHDKWHICYEKFPSQKSPLYKFDRNSSLKTIKMFFTSA